MYLVFKTCIFVDLELLWNLQWCCCSHCFSGVRFTAAEFRGFPIARLFGISHLHAFMAKSFFALLYLILKTHLPFPSAHIGAGCPSGAFTLKLLLCASLCDIVREDSGLCAAEKSINMIKKGSSNLIYPQWTKDSKKKKTPKKPCISQSIIWQSRPD